MSLEGWGSPASQPEPGPALEPQRGRRAQAQLGGAEPRSIWVFRGQWPGGRGSPLCLAASVFSEVSGLEVGAALRRASLSGPVVQQRLFALRLRVTFWKFSQCFRLFHHYCLYLLGHLWSGAFEITTTTHF